MFIVSSHVLCSHCRGESMLDVMVKVYNMCKRNLVGKSVLNFRTKRKCRLYSFYILNMKGTLREIIFNVSNFPMKKQSSTLGNLLKVTQLVICETDAKSQIFWFLNQGIKGNMKIKNWVVLQECSQFKEENKMNTHETTRTYLWVARA